MKNSLNIFSAFVSEIHDRVRTHDAEELARWAVGELSEQLGFDAAWYGWADVRADGVEIYANASLNLPDHYYNTWQTISDQDLLAAEIVQNPGGVASYNRNGKKQTDGMVHLADTYGLEKLVTAMHTRPGRVTSFYISSYRAGLHVRDWSQAEREFLQCAVDQLSCAMKLSTSEPGGAPDYGGATIFVNESGIGILGLENMRRQLGKLWEGWDGDALPDRLRSLINMPGEHILTDRGLMVFCEAAPRAEGMGFRRLTLRRISPVDLLTQRECEVGRLLAKGHSHKEVARFLGVAPNTVRNQTQSIYGKVGVSSRAELAMLFHHQVPRT